MNPSRPFRDTSLDPHRWTLSAKRGRKDDPLCATPSMSWRTFPPMRANESARCRGRTMHAGTIAAAMIRILVVALFAASPEGIAAQSRCFGTTGNGRIEDSVKLPVGGPNFAAYSTLGAAAGRTHVHSRVAEIVAAAYSNLQSERASTVYVYGETGWPSGGRFRPHRTHQNGLSVDFFVPVLKDGKSVPIPTHAANRFGYDIEFDGDARFGRYRMDFPALAEHLYQLHATAKSHGAGISLVIFDTTFLPDLFATPRGGYLRRNLRFMKGEPWVRHDEHYHVDFAIPCQPIPR